MEPQGDKIAIEGGGGGARVNAVTVHGRDP